MQSLQSKLDKHVRRIARLLLLLLVNAPHTWPRATSWLNHAFLSYNTTAAHLPTQLFRVLYRLP
jgi:hypothetical protein